MEQARRQRSKLGLGSRTGLDELMKGSVLYWQEASPCGPKLSETYFLPLKV